MGLPQKWIILAILTAAAVPVSAHAGQRANCIRQSLETIAAHELTPEAPITRGLVREIHFLESYLQTMKSTDTTQIKLAHQLFEVRTDGFFHRTQSVLDLARTLPRTTETAPLLDRLAPLEAKHRQWARERHELRAQHRVPIDNKIVFTHTEDADFADLPDNMIEIFQIIRRGQIKRPIYFESTTTDPRVEAEKAQTFLEIHRIGEELRRHVPNKTSVSDPVETMHLGGDPAANRAEIVKYGLLPKHSLTYREGLASFHFSDPFMMVDGRVGVVAKIQTADKKVLRIFYLSNSNGVFRLLPAVNYKISPHLPGWDKAIGQHSLAPPPEVQKFLSEKLSATQLTQAVPEHVWAGVVRENRKFADYIDYLQNEMHYIGKSVSEVKVLNQSGVPQDGSKHIVAPESIRIADSGDRPNFARETLSWKMNNELAGAVEAKTYDSFNGKYQYVIMKDASNRIWIANIFAKDAPITHFGTPSLVVDGGALTTPLWEYTKSMLGVMRGDYFGASHPRRGEYMLAWKFLREIPEIQRYYQETGTQMPE